MKLSLFPLAMILYSLFYSTYEISQKSYGCPQAYSYHFYEKAVLKIASIYRNYDGSNNNIQHPNWGKTNSTLKRNQPSAYANFRSSLSGQNRPKPRVISNQVCATSANELQEDPRRLSGLFLVWGQFISHDLHHTPFQTGPTAQQANMQVPSGDSFFDPNGTGNKVIQFNRSLFDERAQSRQFPREQLNALNSWIDGQMIYGNSQVIAAGLRTFEKGKLKLDSSNLLTKQGIVYVSGDKRVNQNVILISINTLFVRQHNRICQQIALIFPYLSDQQLYQYSRNYVTALISKINYDDYLPLLLGTKNLKSYNGYENNVEPTITSVFSTSAFRYAHFTIPKFFFKINDTGAVVEKMLSRDGTQNPSKLSKKQDIGLFLKGESLNVIKKRSEQVTDEMRNFLALAPNNRTHLIDLAATNIQRGRDHGLPDYNTFRRYYGLKAYSSFNQLTKNSTVVEKLVNCYGNINLLDSFIGILVEDSLPDSSIGELGSAIIRQTFWRVRASDRFWYQNSFPQQIIKQIKETSLADIIIRNTQIKNISSNVFVVPQ